MAKMGENWRKWQKLAHFVIGLKMRSILKFENQLNLVVWEKNNETLSVEANNFGMKTCLESYHFIQILELEDWKTFWI